MSGFEHPVSAAVARRLAEAADGFRNGEPVYIVADARDPGEVQTFTGEGAREAAEQARDAWEAAGGGDGISVFGPFQTGPDPAGGAGPRPEVLDVTVRVRLPDGATQARVFGAGEADALFWTRAAVDKFVVPYYAAALGLEHANGIAASFSEEAVYMLAHLPDTTIIAVGATGTGGEVP